MKRFAIVCRFALGAVFLAACIPKILSPNDFAVVIFRYQMVPHDLINLFALFLPWFELITALALMFSRTFREAAAIIIMGMLAMFTVAMTINIFRGINVACGCFSVDPSASHMGWLNILRNVLLLGLAAVVWIGHKREARDGQGK